MLEWWVECCNVAGWLVAGLVIVVAGGWYWWWCQSVSQCICVSLWLSLDLWRDKRDSESVTCDAGLDSDTLTG